MEDKSMIAIADDDVSDRYLIKLAFEEAGVDVNISEFEDGAELIDYISQGCKSGMPKFLLLDLNMPKRSGMEVLQFMQENPTLCPMPVIVLSTSSDQNDIRKSKELGAVDYITKPSDYSGYVDIVKSLDKYLPK
jgi:CheY-like chemotaxis protein